jgi:hypothetical protein
MRDLKRSNPNLVAIQTTVRISRRYAPYCTSVNPATLASPTTADCVTTSQPGNGIQPLRISFQCTEIPYAGATEFGSFKGSVEAVFLEGETFDPGSIFLDKYEIVAGKVEILTPPRLQGFYTLSGRLIRDFHVDHHRGKTIVSIERAIKGITQLVVTIDEVNYGYIQIKGGDLLRGGKCSAQVTGGKDHP